MKRSLIESIAAAFADVERYDILVHTLLLSPSNFRRLLKEAKDKLDETPGERSNWKLWNADVMVREHATLTAIGAIEGFDGYLVIYDEKRIPKRIIKVGKTHQPRRRKTMAAKAKVFVEKSEKTGDWWWRIRQGQEPLGNSCEGYEKKSHAVRMAKKCTSAALPLFVDGVKVER